MEGEEEVYVALNRGPWLIKECLLALVPWSPSLHPLDLGIESFYVWMYVYGLPFFLHTKEVAGCIARKLGTFINVRLPRTLQSFNHALAICVVAL